MGGVSLKLPALSYVFEQEWLVHRCATKSVLHLGCAGASTVTGGRESSLHAKILDVAQSACGVELQADSIAAMARIMPESERNSYIQGDVTDLEATGLEQQFDVIVAGSIIEHLSNPGLMIEGCARLLKQDGLLLISTPHTWGLLQFLRVALRRVEAIDPEHTCWYSIPTLSALTSRYGFQPVEWATGYGWRTRYRTNRLARSAGIAFFERFPHLGGSLLGAFRRCD
jgi:2-polyprenyl-3-methyl-5-hydroxy-6-metoxy-1,4-benzoquinol methylase